MRRRDFFALTTAAPLLAALPATGVAAASRSGGPPTTRAFPTTLHLPDGFQPEGIAIGRDHGRWYAWFGSLANGDIYRADLRTGTGRVLGRGPGTPSVGLDIDRAGRLFVAGGAAGNGRLVDARTGRIEASFDFAAEDSFVNDVVLHRGDAWFTDSVRPYLYRVTARGGRGRHHVETVPLRGEIEYAEGFNLNGITVTPDRTALIAVQSNTGRLFRIAPDSGEATPIDVEGALMTNGDGLLVSGRLLYVVRNRSNQVAVIEVNHAGTKGRVVATLTDPRFDVPTTVAAFGDRLCLPNARFGTPPEPTTPYTAVIIRAA